MLGIFKKTIELLYKDDERERAIQNDTLWKPEESLWVAFLLKDIPIANLNKNHLLPFFVDKGFKITPANKGVRLSCTLSTKKIDTVLGFNEKEERMLHAKFTDEAENADVEDNAIYFNNIFNDLADYLALSHCLRSQKYDSSATQVYKGQTRAERKLSKQETAIAASMETDTFERATDPLTYTALLSKDPTKEVLIDLLLAFSGDQGLTCKMEGKSTVRSASSELVVQCKLGFNETNVRILEIQNQVSFLGGDKTGKIFSDFVKKLGTKLARCGYLASQQQRPVSPPIATPTAPKTPEAVHTISGSPNLTNPGSPNAPLRSATSVEKVGSPGSKERMLSRKGSSVELQRGRGSFLDLNLVNGAAKKPQDEVEIEETKIVVKTHIANVATRGRNASIASPSGNPLSESAKLTNP